MIRKRFIFKPIRIIIKCVLFLLALVVGFIIYTNISVNNFSSSYIFKADDTNNITKADAVLVLGTLVVGEDTLSPALKDRMDTGIALYEEGKASKLLLSGDHGQATYDEVNAMKEYAVSCGVKEEDIFLDHAGFSTYESMYRAKDVFQCSSVIIVSQEFHLPRAVYVANKLKLDAIGVIAEANSYTPNLKTKLREYIAVPKDFLYVNILKPLPKYLGEVISIFGDGRLTNG